MRQVTPRELLDIRERAWGPRLRGVSLVAEAEVKPGQAEQVARVLGAIYQKRIDAGRPPEALFQRWPACVAVATTWVAAERYRKGTFWPYLWEAIGYHGNDDAQRVWGRGFLYALADLGLPVFEKLPLPFVGPILMHSGIPTYCLGDFFQLLAQRRRTTPGLTGEAFMAWATAPGRELRLDEIDVPARHFLRYGGDFALDVVERSLDLLDRLQARELDGLGGVGLPERFVRHARELAERGELRLDAPLGTARGETVRERPQVVLDPFGRGVEIRLPAIGDTPDGVATWQITADGVRTTVRSRPLWVGAAEDAPATSFALPGPVRTVLVALGGSALESELQVVDPDDPLLVFTEDGRMVPAGVPLPSEPVWVLHPEDAELRVDGPLDERAEGALPLGWAGWRLRMLALDQVTSIGLGRTRTVRGFARPRVVVGEPVPGVTTPYGSPVFAAPPDVWLPGTDGTETTWLVEIRRSGSGETVLSRRLTTSEPTTVNDLWDGLARPLVGGFDVMVRGPLGRGTRRSVVVAEGLRVAFRPAARLFATRGLAEAEARCTAAPGCRVVPELVPFGSDELAHVVTYEAPGASDPLIVTPPHLEVLHERTSEGSAWSARPLRLATEDFDDPGALLVRLPGAAELPPLHVVTSRGTVHSLPPGGRTRGGMARYELARIRDTIGEFRSADLVLDETPLAFVRPRRLARAVYDRGDHLLLEDAADVEGLTAGVYLVTAPWRPPWVLPVEHGRVELPVELRGSGPVRVLLQIEDPWTFTEWPRWPHPKGLDCDRPGWFAAGDEEETALAGFLVGEAAFPRRVERLERLWTVLEWAPQLERAGAAPYVSGPCAGRLGAEPQEAVRALLAAGLPPAKILPLLIALGIAAAPMRGTLGDDVRQLWSVAPAAAVLFAHPGDTEWWEAATTECGPALTTILAEGRDPHASVGRFGPEAARLAHMTSEQLESVWRSADIVPRALLDADTRLTAARRLFDARTTPVARSLSRYAHDVLARTRRAVEASGRPELLAQLRARTSGEAGAGWQSLPAVSVALALTARLAARGEPDATTCETALRGDWHTLATLSPDLVASDLVVAELLLLSTEHDWRPYATQLEEPPSGLP
ncbi:hypothetical protein [Actinomadura miaoliensis]|uniref:Uncharacterized protein n=1 Tax=Actinomadura miaoliensis TaxID=430685 RepID=A0ABP7W5M0_9ACTN